jgi:hypothetical protein
MKGKLTDDHGLTRTSTDRRESVFVRVPLFYAQTVNSTPWASGSSVPQLIVQVWRRM